MEVPRMQDGNIAETSARLRRKHIRTLELVAQLKKENEELRAKQSSSTEKKESSGIDVKELEDRLSKFRNLLRTEQLRNTRLLEKISQSEKEQCKKENFHNAKAKAFEQKVERKAIELERELNKQKFLVKELRDELDVLQRENEELVENAIKSAERVSEVEVLNAQLAKELTLFKSREYEAQDLEDTKETSSVNSPPYHNTKAFDRSKRDQYVLEKQLDEAHNRIESLTTETNHLSNDLRKTQNDLSAAMKKTVTCSEETTTPKITEEKEASASFRATIELRRENQRLKKRLREVLKSQKQLLAKGMRPSKSTIR
eukprot:g1860.t1